MSAVAGSTRVSSSGGQRAVSNSASIPVSKPPCQIDNKAIISDKAILVGSHTIIIGANTVIHPYAKLDSTWAPVTVGQNVIISERTVIGVGEANKDKYPSGVTIEDSVSIETGAVVEATKIGKGSIVGIQSIIKVAVSVGEVRRSVKAILVCAIDSIVIVLQNISSIYRQCGGECPQLYDCHWSWTAPS